MQAALSTSEFSKLEELNIRDTVPLSSNNERLLGWRPDNRTGLLSELTPCFAPSRGHLSRFLCCFLLFFPGFLPFFLQAPHAHHWSR